MAITQSPVVPPAVVDDPESDEELAAALAADPYFYGWRDVYRTLPDGTEAWEQIPLTRYDVLHPQEDDFIMQTDLHDQTRTYLRDVLTAQLVADPHAVVVADLRIAWDVPDVEPMGPDITVFYGVRERQDWSTFDCAEEGVRPSLVVEITSPATRRSDLRDKVALYERVGIPLYVIADIRRRRQPKLRLLAYRATPAGYVEVPPDDRGWIELAPTGIWLGIEGERFICYDAVGTRLGDYVEVVAQRDAAEAARQAAEAARQAADARAAAEAARAETEARAHAEVEARLRALEAELRRLRGNGSG